MVPPLTSTLSSLGKGRFEVLRTIGQGGCGIVYEVFDTERRARIALKTLTELTPAALYRFKREFRALGDVSHDNLVSLYELMSDGDGWFFTMELVAGVDVLAYVRREEAHDGGERSSAPSPPREQLPTGRVERAHTPPRVHGPPDLSRLRASLGQLALGLHALHGTGKLHRDVKPSNVLVTAEGRVVILDFGIATELASTDVSVTDMDAIIGTPAYMSPEQVAGDPLTEASDWYAVGVILYEALSGRRPFYGTATQVMLDKQRFEPPRVREVTRASPEDLEALCTDLLRRDPKRRPSGAEVLRRLGVGHGDRRGRAPTTTSQTARVPFLGRETELRSLEDAFLDTRRGKAVTMFLEGTSGMGKTALVRRFLEDVAVNDPDAVLLSGRCYERESMPYKAFDTVVDALMRHLLRIGDTESAALVPRDAAFLARVFPVLERVPAIARAPRRPQETPDPHQLRRRAFGALRELLQRLADRRPVVVFIDDLQWGDADSAALLAELTGPPEPPSILILLGYRSEDAETSLTMVPLLRGAAAAGSAERRTMAIEALAPRDAETLARALLGRTGPSADAIAAKIAVESAGNPFFLGELVRFAHADETRLAARQGAEALTLEKVLLHRFGELPPHARTLLEVLSVAGRPVRTAVAMAAAGLAHEDGRQASAQLRLGNLARSAGPSGELLEPYHDRVRETVLAALPPLQQVAHHAALVRAITEAGDGDPEMLFVHSRAAGLDELAAKYAEVAAEKASRALAFDRAAQLYRMAIEVIREPARIQRLQASLGEAYANAGRSGEAARAYLAAIEGATAAQQLELRRRAAEQLLFGGHVDEGRVLVEAVLREVHLSMAPNRWRAVLAIVWLRIWLALRGLRFKERDESAIASTQLERIDVCWSLAAGLGINDTLLGAEFSTRNLIYALDAGEPWRLCRAATLEAGYLAGYGSSAHARTTQLVDLARRLAAKVNRPDTNALLECVSGWVPYFAGQWRLARTHFEESMRVYRDSCTGTRWELDTVQLFHLFVLYLLGDLKEFARLHPRYLREAEERGDRYLATNLRLAMVSPSLIEDDVKTARREVDVAMAQWSQRGFTVQHWFQACVLSRLDLYEGNPSFALDRLQAIWPKLRRAFLLQIQMVRGETRMLRASAALACAVGPKAGERIRLAERDAKKLLGEGVGWLEAYGLRILAAAAVRRGDLPRATSYLERAIEAFDRNDMTGLAAGARFRLAAIVQGARGEELDALGRAWMQSEGVTRPEAMIRVLAPGFDDRAVADQNRPDQPTP